MAIWNNRTRRPAPEHGIQFKNGPRSWWSDRWIKAIEESAPSGCNRMARGRTYARKGRAFSFEIKAGKLVAKVIGTRSRPYVVRVKLAQYRVATWREIISRMDSQAKVRSQLLVDILPEELESLFSEVGASLFPEAGRGLESSCTCPDGANPCKHIAAVLYGVGQLLDQDPLLLLELHGIKREKLFEILEEATRAPKTRKRVKAATRDASKTQCISARDYDRMPDPELWQGWEPLSFGSEIFTLAELDPPGRWDAKEPPGELLAPVIERAALHARIILDSVDGDSEEEAAARPKRVSKKTRGGVRKAGKKRSGVVRSAPGRGKSTKMRG